MPANKARLSPAITPVPAVSIVTAVIKPPATVIVSVGAAPVYAL